MRINVVFIFVFFTQLIYSQFYLPIDELAKQYNIKKYTLSTEKMYDVDGEIEVYNLFQKNYGKTEHIHLQIFSVFPDIKDGTTWHKVENPDSIRSQTITITDFIRKIYNRKSDKEYNRFQLLKVENGVHYVSKNCLLEYFVIVDYPPYFHLSGKNLVNKGQNITTYNDIRKYFGKRENLPMETSSNGVWLWDYLASVYLSSVEEIKGEKIYRFWTFEDWSDEKGINSHRGIDRFAYIEGKGIVGGSYDFYFDNTTEGFKRVVRNDIMWAKELFPDR